MNRKGISLNDTIGDGLEGSFPFPAENQQVCTSARKVRLAKSSPSRTGPQNLAANTTYALSESSELGVPCCQWRSTFD